MAFSFGTPAAQPASGGGLFGSPAPAAPAASSGGLFGAQPQQPPAPGSTFGGFGAQPAAPKPAFSFGSPAPAPAGQAPQSNLFGSTPAPSTSLFGQPQQQQQQQQPSTSLFGQPQQQQQQPTQGLFGAQPQQQQQQQQNTGLFGSTSQPPQQQQQQPNSFGQQSQGPLGISQLGGSIIGQQGSGADANAGPVKLEDLPIEQRIEYIKGAWDPSSPTCKFQYFFYNLVPPNEAHLYGRPQNARDDAAWFKAQRENPDPSTMVPALAIGFDDIRKRTDAQMKMAGAHWNKLQEISTRLSTVSSSSHLSLSLRLSRLQLLQTQLSHRTLLLIRHLHLLIPTLRSSSIRREEEALLQRLEQLTNELGASGGRGTGGNVKGRMMELWALIGQVRGERERDRMANGGGGGGEGGGAGGKEGWAVVDEEAMERLATIISDQQTALSHLTKVLKEDLAAIEIMRHGLGLSQSKDGSGGDVAGGKRI